METFKKSVPLSLPNENKLCSISVEKASLNQHEFPSRLSKILKWRIGFLSIHKWISNSVGNAKLNCNVNCNDRKRTWTELYFYEIWDRQADRKIDRSIGPSVNQFYQSINLSVSIIYQSINVSVYASFLQSIHTSMPIFICWYIYRSIYQFIYLQ